MEEFAKLLTQYSLTDIILVGIGLALSIKSFVTFYDWVIDRLRKKFGKEEKEKSGKEEVMDKINDTHEILNEIIRTQKEISDKVESMANIIDTLIKSDKNDIKAWITEKHHYFVYKVGHIDDYSLDCIEKRYKCYKDEGGNSYITTLVEEIRKLPKTSDIECNVEDMGE